MHTPGLASIVNSPFEPEDQWAHISPRMAAATSSTSKHMSEMLGLELAAPCPLSCCQTGVLLPPTFSWGPTCFGYSTKRMVRGCSRGEPSNS